MRAPSATCSACRGVRLRPVTAPNGLARSARAGNGHDGAPTRWRKFGSIRDRQGDLAGEAGVHRRERGVKLLVERVLAALVDEQVGPEVLRRAVEDERDEVEPAVVRQLLVA